MLSDFFDTVGANVWYGDSFVPYRQNFSLSHYSKTRFFVLAHNRERITIHLEIDSKSVSELFRDQHTSTRLRC